LEDWYRVGLKHINTAFTITPFEKFSKEKLLTQAYPNHQWDVVKLQVSIGPSKSSQRMMFRLLEEIFPNTRKFQLEFIDLFPRLKYYRGDRRISAPKYALFFWKKNRIGCIYSLLSPGCRISGETTLL
jgi:hypothetical protein